MMGPAAISGPAPGIANAPIPASHPSAPPITAPEPLLNAAEQWGVPSSAKVLSLDEMSGREISDPTPDAQAAVDLVWGLLAEVGLTNGKAKPPVKSFVSILDGGVKLNGYYRDGTVFINEDLGRTSSIAGGAESLSNRLVKVALEECVHFTTGATDNSRDFQDYLLDLVVRLARRPDGNPKRRKGVGAV